MTHRTERIGVALIKTGAAIRNRMRRYSASRFGLPSNSEADSPVD